MKSIVGYSFLLFIFASCSLNKERQSKTALTIDSLCFNYFSMSQQPRLIKVCSYALNDSLSIVLDTLRNETLTNSNLIQIGSDQNLSFSRRADTIIVEVVHGVPMEERFLFGNLKVNSDTIELRFNGYVVRNNSAIHGNHRHWFRYYKTIFTIKSDDSLNYKILYKN